MNSVAALQPPARRALSAIGIFNLAVALFAPSVVRAQLTASFSGNRTTVLSGAGLSPAGIALDSAGNVYIADDSSNSILKVPAGGGTAVTVASGLASTSAVAVDASGNVFVALPGTASNGSIIEIPWTGSKYGNQVTVTSGISSPSAVAVDVLDDVFFVSSAGGYVGEVPVSSYGTKTPGILGSGLKNPSGLAIDIARNLFIADTGNNRVVALGFLGSSYGAPLQIATGLNGPWGISVDSVDNVFVTDPADNQIVKIPSTSTAWGTPTTLAAGFNAPQALALDSIGDFFVGETGNQQVVELQPYSANFGSFNVCTAGQTTPAPCSQTIALNYHLSAFPASIGVSAMTLGVEDLDFNFDAASSSCISNPSGGQDCAVSVVFSPQYPGARRGAVQIFDGDSGGLLATTPVFGTGVAPQIGFLSATPVLQAPSGGLFTLTGFAVDGAGNMYFANAQNNIVYELNSQGEFQTTLGNGLSGPEGLALDGAGNLFIADNGNGRIVEVPAGGGPQLSIPVAAAPGSLAVDGAGNLYYTNPRLSEIVEVPVGGGTAIALGSGLSLPLGFVLDGAGNIFVADFGHNRVVKILPGGAGEVVVGNGLNIKPVGVAVDAGGDVYIADSENNQIIEYTAGTGLLLTLTDNSNELQSLANDSAGNLYYINGSGAYKLPLSQPPSFAFANTRVGSISADSPNGGAVQNTGNLPLVFSSSTASPDPIYPVDFPEYTDTGSCYAGISLAPGANCDVAIKFQPSVGGTINENVVLIDNSLNQPNATQSIAVSGTAPQVAPQVNWATPAPINLGTLLSALQLDAYSQVAGTFTYSPKLGAVLPAGWNKLSATFVPADTVDYTTVTISVNLWVANVVKLQPKVAWVAPAAITYGAALDATQLNATASLPGTFVYTPAAGSVLKPGSQTLSVTFTPTDSADYATVTANVTLVVNKAAPPLSWPTPAAIRYGTALGASQLNATSPVGGTFVYTPAAGTVLKAGSRTLLVTFTPTDSTDFTTQSASIALQVSRASLTVTATSITLVYGKPLPKLTFAASGFVNGDTLASLAGSPTETSTAKVGSLPGKYPITIAQATLASANYSFTFKSGMLTIVTAGSVSLPVFNPAGGTFASGTVLHVTVKSATPNAVIHYTTNGAAPTASSSKYVGPIPVKANETIKALAAAPGYTNSSIATAKFTIQ